MRMENNFIFFKIQNYRYIGVKNQFPYESKIFSIIILVNSHSSLAKFSFCDNFEGSQM